MDVTLKCSLVCILMAVAVWPVASPLTPPAATRFANGSHLYDYLYGGGTADERHGGTAGGEDPWQQLVELFSAVAFNGGPGGRTHPRGHRSRRQASSFETGFYSHPGHQTKDGFFQYQAFGEEAGEETTEEESESLPFFGEVAFAFPLVLLDIPYSGIKIPMFDYDSRNYYD
ncbi:uncharacterized protein LOC122371388 [Amphibalanus amphitrite]|uniref:uncharacterized protein LOC122371388 n=1 Tax=Amphibalanus amphitrite TaxID=1232801 RepID=UPI001C917AE0|nr:uncharacterized protein LOC122371388 [Amphibalanus amphitrite]